MAKIKEDKADSVEPKKVKAVAPKLYEDGPISMSSGHITTKADFLKLFKGTTVARQVNLSKAYEKAKRWREKYK